MISDKKLFENKNKIQILNFGLIGLIWVAKLNDLKTTATKIETFQKHYSVQVTVCAEQK